MYPKKQSFLVFGLSKSGYAAAEFLLARGASVYMYDDIASARVKNIITDLGNKGAKWIEKENIIKAVEYCDALVLSPGIPIDNSLAVLFKRNGKAVLGECELAARYLRCPILAVTGTNGKTTTVSMLAETLTRGALSAKACGNIGTPLVDFCSLEENEVAVAEISSFQLETLNSLCPHIAVVLNITEDHLNRHYNMENYVFVKQKLLKNLTETEYAVLNYDDLIVRGFSEKTKAKILYFSVKERVQGAYYENGALYFGKEKIIEVSELSLTGLHNVQNALACIIVAKLMGITTADIASSLREFKGIKHRIEIFEEMDGVKYVDDSKGTNVDATLRAIESMQEDTILLLGGKNKGYQYDKLFAGMLHSKIIHAILYGENRYELLKSARVIGFENITVCAHFDFAVQVAMLQAQRGQTVLLSPASASFDEFSSYEERGERFVEIVRTKTKENRSNEQIVFDEDRVNENTKETEDKGE